MRRKEAMGRRGKRKEEMRGKDKAEEEREAGNQRDWLPTWGRVSRLQSRAPHARTSAPPRLPLSENFGNRGAEQAALAGFQHIVTAVSAGCSKWNN